MICNDSPKRRTARQSPPACPSPANSGCILGTAVLFAHACLALICWMVVSLPQLPPLSAGFCAVVPRRMCQGRWQVNVVAVAPVCKVGQQVGNNQERLFFVPKRTRDNSCLFAEGYQSRLRPRRTFVVGNALIAGCSVIGDSVSHVEFISKWQSWILASASAPHRMLIHQDLLNSELNYVLFQAEVF